MRRVIAKSLLYPVLLLAVIALGGCEQSEPTEEDAPATLLANVALSDTHERFQSQTGTQFEVLYDDWHRLPVVLESVKAGPSDPRLDQFMVLFRSEQEPVLGERTYTMEHPSLGSFELFVKPSRGEAGQYYYQGAISVLLPPES